MKFSVLKKAMVVLCFLAVGLGTARGQSALPFLQSDFGDLPDSLFTPGQYPVHPNVPFIYSLKKLNITFEEDASSIIAVMEYHVRVKIFDSSVKEAAIVGIPYYFKNHIERISNIRGYTYQSVNKKTPLDPDQIRTININSRYNVKEFTMPDVKDGSVIEYIYTIRRRYIEELPDFYLANQVPTKRAEVSITYPKYLRYKGISQNYKGSLNHFITRVDTSMVPKVFTYPQPAPIVKETWRAVDVPAVQKEAYISTLDDYRGKIKFQLSEFGIPRQTLENSWKYVVAEIRRKQHITKHINDNRQAYQRGKQISRALDDPRAIQDSVFHYINKKMEYSGSKAPFTSTNDKPVLQGKPSNQAAINQTLIAMLRGAGIDAYPVLISSRESGQINRSFPSFFQFNGQLVYSKIGERSYIMDASYEYSEPNLIPVDMYNETGLLLKPHSFQWLDIKPDASSFTLQVEINGKLDRQGNLTGRLEAKNTGYPAQQIRKQYAEGSSFNQIIRKSLLDGYQKAIISNGRLQKVGNDKGTIALAGNFTLKNYAISYRDGIDFRPMIVGYLRHNPFNNDKQRNLPVTLDAPEHLNLIYNIALPKGMHLAKKPKSRALQLPGAILNEHYMESKSKLKYVLNIDIFNKKFSPDLFPRLLNLYKQWVQISNTRWRLKR